MDVRVYKSEKQLILERQGHVFNGQELLDNHEIDETKECYCGRPVIPANTESQPKAAGQGEQAV